MSRTIWGIAMMRDEADIAYDTIVHMAEEGLDGILVADNLSEDATRAELDRAAADVAPECEVVVVADNDPAYFQSRKMTALAEQAAAMGAEWIIPFDADELWLARDRVGFILGHLPPEVMVATAALYNHFPSAIDPDTGCAFRDIGWRQSSPGALPKVAIRWQPGTTIHQGNHGVSFADQRMDAMRVPALLIRHFPYRTRAQFIHKARKGAEAYKATNLPVEQGAHWRQYGAILEREGEEALGSVFDRWFWNLAPVEAGLVFDPAPFRRWTSEQHTEPAPPADKENA